ncbi:MAG: recombinase family protein [Clostridiales bacterium]|nr:recombinase family protein [Clostridiales bacterium]
MCKIIGYVRVSTQEQNLDRQLKAMDEYGVPKENVFSDHGFSGKDFNRPAYQDMVAILEKGDTLVIKSIDRLGRDFDEINDEWSRLTRRMGVTIIVLDMPYLNETANLADAMSKMLNSILLNMKSGFAQMEREMIRQRQKEGIAAAKARGVQFGRPKKDRTQEFYILKERYLAGEISARKAAKQLCISHSTFCNWVAQNS